jgi:hypothetical protein
MTNQNQRKDEDDIRRKMASTAPGNIAARVITLFLPSSTPPAHHRSTQRKQVSLLIDAAAARKAQLLSLEGIGQGFSCRDVRSLFDVREGVEAIQDIILF